MGPGYVWKPMRKDPFFDRIIMSCGEPVTGIDMIELAVVERWKESEISGEEWRHSWGLKATGPGVTCPVTRGCGFYEEAALGMVCKFVRELVDEQGWDSLVYNPTTVRIYRKGAELFDKVYGNLAAAALEMTWDAVTFGEQPEFNAEKTRSYWNGYCGNPGCPEKATVVLQIKQQYEGPGAIKHDDSSLGPARRGFCERHAHRGDCAIEDSDDNYIVIEAPDTFNRETRRTSAEMPMREPFLT